MSFEQSQPALCFIRPTSSEPPVSLKLAQRLPSSPILANTSCPALTSKATLTARSRTRQRQTSTNQLEVPAATLTQPRPLVVDLHAGRDGGRGECEGHCGTRQDQRVHEAQAAHQRELPKTARFGQKIGQSFPPG